MRTGLYRYVDAPERYERLFLPLVAWLLAFGHAAWVDAAYILAVLAFLFAGVWIAAKWSVVQGHTPWWGLGFALLPGTLISVDRMTVDVAEYALVAAALYSWRTQKWLACWMAASAAFLTRELGLLVILAVTGLSLLDRAWRRAILFACAAVPGILWYRHVERTIVISKTLRVVPRWVFRTTLIGPFYAIFHPPKYPLMGWTRAATQVLDGVAIAGVVVAVCLAILVLIRRRPLTLEAVLCACYVVVFVMVASNRFWVDPYSYSRAFSPLAGLIAWRGVTERRACFAIPLLCMLPRIIWQLGPQALGIARSLFA
jgi:hypothetical protein